MKKLSLLTSALAATLISGCAVIPQAMHLRPAVEPEYQLDEVHIKWIRIDPTALPTVSLSGSGETDARVGGVSFLSDGKSGVNSKCVVLVPLPQVNDDEAMRMLGHEVSHCFLGRWHGHWGHNESAEVGRSQETMEETRQGAFEVVHQYFPGSVSEVESFLMNSTIDSDETL